MTAEERFPIMDGPSVPWWYMEPHDRQCQKNHGGQTLRGVASRGGLSCAEAEQVVCGRKWAGYTKQDIDQWTADWKARAEKVNRPCVPVAEIERVAEQIESRRELVLEENTTEYSRGFAAAMLCDANLLRSRLLPTPRKDETDGTR